MAVGAAISCILGTPAWAQQTDSPPAATDQPALQEVIVTARRHSENLEQVPIAVSAFSPTELENEHIVSAVDLATFSPSMTSGTLNSNSDAPTFAIRGQATTQFGAPGVVVYFAEVPLSFFGLSAVDGRPGTYYDLDNVQVLNGPQGTLFGKNATGGSILFVPKKPDDELDGYVQAEGGDFGDKRVQGAFNVPLVPDKVLFRVAGEIDRRQGYVTDVGTYFPGKDYNNVHDESVRASLIVRPFDALENYTILRSYREDTNGPGYFLADFNPQASGGLVTALYPGMIGYPAQAAANGVFHASYDTDQRDIYKYWQAINTTTAHLNSEFNLKNIVSYAEYREALTYDLAATPFPLFEIVTPPGQYYNAPNLLTEELQLQGHLLDRALYFTVGGYYDQQNQDSPAFTSVLIPLNYLFNGFNEAAPLDTYAYFKTGSHAAFTQTTYDFGNAVPALAGLSFTAGYRYTWEHVTSYYFLDKVPDQGPAINTNRFSYGSYTLGPDYKLSRNLMTYLTVRSASKSGGSNLYEPNGSPYLNFSPEKLQDVEIGLKSAAQPDGIRMLANIAVYRGRYTNIQRQVDVTYLGVPAFITLNTAEARVQGLELQGDIAPIAPLTLSLSYDYIDAAYTKATTIGALTLGTGPFPFTPRNKVSMGGTYTVSLGSSAGLLGFNATYTYQGRESPADTEPSFVTTIPGHKLLNLRVNWSEFFGQPLEVALFVTNATNAQYISNVNDGYYKPFGTVSYGYGEPRMYGVQLTWRFDK